MEFKQNLHQHTNFCDGECSAEEMVLCAIEKGFDSLGFSGHSHSTFSPVYTMTEEKTELYIKEINRLKKVYKDQIEIYLGIEFDYLSDIDFAPYDYVIGSVHGFKKNDGFIAFDRSKEVVKGIIDDYFNGDGMQYVKMYYQYVAKLPERCKKLDIVGHFDLITKHAESVCFFDTESKEYKNYVFEALHALREKVEIFEVNTGAIARGYRTTPYPAPFIMKELKNLNARLIISSDCHNKNFMDYKFNEMEEYVKSFGFNSIAVLKNGKFIDIKI